MREEDDIVVGVGVALVEESLGSEAVLHGGDYGDGCGGSG